MLRSNYNGGEFYRAKYLYLDGDVVEVMAKL